MLKYAAKVLDVRVDDPVLCVALWSQHSAGPVLEWYHGKERIQQPKVISKELKLVLYFHPNAPKSAFLSYSCLSELKPPRVENPKRLPFSHLAPMVLPCLPVLLL